MLVVPGLAVPTGTNAYSLFADTSITNFSTLLQGFYQLKNGEFFVILILQQTMFGFFGSINYLSILFYFWLSPSAFLLFKKQPIKERMFLKEESITFDYGYINALNLTMLGIVFIYS